MFAGELKGTATSTKPSVDKNSKKTDCSEARGSAPVESGGDPLFNTTIKASGKADVKKKSTTPGNKALFDDDEDKYVFVWYI